MTRYLSEAELGKLLSYVREKAHIARLKGATRSVIDELLVLLLVHTGMRASEVCNLTISDIAAGQRQNKIRVRGSGRKIHRFVVIPSAITKHIEAFIDTYRKPARPRDPFLINERGNKFTYMSVYSKIRRIGEESKIGKLHPQMLRATYLIRLYRSKQDIGFVQRQAGHASPGTTAAYAIASAPPDRRIAAALSGDSSVKRGSIRCGNENVSDNQTTPKAITSGEAVSIGDSGRSLKCEACDRALTGADWTRIDSGQVLCADCLSELRNLTSL